MTTGAAELILFARQPVAGEVKTRLQPEYSPEQAASIAQYLIETSVANAISHWRGPVSIYASPSITHPVFQDLAERYQIALYKQNGADLGMRMYAAITDGIERHGSAAVMGCDIPHCPPSVFKDAFSLLSSKHEVLGPTNDGGYYFIGMAEPHVELFTDIEWGADRVLPDTLGCAESLGLNFVLLETLQDIDTAADIAEVAENYPGLRQFLNEGATTTAATAGGTTKTVVGSSD